MALSAFRAFTFDCYGTLIDWERGILEALRSWTALSTDDEALLAAFRQYENPLKTRRPALPYPEGLCCKPDVGVSQIRTTTVLSSCFCVGQTVL